MSKNIALVTGANKGIGFGVAMELAQKGFQVFLTGRSWSKVEIAAEKLKKRSLDVVPLSMDVSSESSIKKAAEEFGKAADHLDVLVNNAGILLDKKDSIALTEPKLFEETFLTNVVGPILTIQKFLPYLKKSKQARVINVSSGAGSLSESPTYAPSYSVSKTALNKVTVLYSDVLSEDGITVNSVCPGWVRTDMGGSTAPRSIQEGADTIVWLASEAPKNLTGKFFRDRKEIPW